MPTRRSKGDGTLFKRSDGVWIAAVDIPTADGKRRRKTVSSRDRGQALAKLRALKKEIEAGAVPTTAQATVQRWLEHWLETIHRPHIRPGTYGFYEKVVRLYINPRIGKKRLDRLTAEDVRGMIRGLQANEQTRAAQTAHQVLKVALKDAIIDGLISRNVVEAVKKPGHVAKEQDAFTAEDAIRIIQTAIAHDEALPPDSKKPLLATRWAAAFYTGARESELLGLEWDRVEFDRKRLVLSWQLQRHKKAHGCGGTCGKRRCPQARWNFPPGFKYRECYKSLVWTEPKSKAGVRTVFLTPFLLALLTKFNQMDAGENPHGLVWHHRDGRPITQEDDHKAWTALLKEAGVPYLSIHSARHTAASLLQGGGVSEETRMRGIGHSSLTAHRGYLHPVEEKEYEQWSVLDDILAIDNDAPLKIG